METEAVGQRVEWERLFPPLHQQPSSRMEWKDVQKSSTITTTILYMWMYFNLTTNIIDPSRTSNPWRTRNRGHDFALPNVSVNMHKNLISFAPYLIYLASLPILPLPSLDDFMSRVWFYTSCSFVTRTCRVGFYNNNNNNSLRWIQSCTKLSSC